MAQFEFRGIGIDLDHNGYFKATVDGAELVEATLAAIHVAIDRELTVVAKNIRVSLPITGIVTGVVNGHHEDSVALGAITAINRNSGSLIISGNPHSWTRVLTDSEANRQLCAEYVEVGNHFTALRRKVDAAALRSPASGRVAAHEYADLIEKLTQEYKRKADQ